MPGGGEISTWAPGSRRADVRSCSSPWHRLAHHVGECRARASTRTSVVRAAASSSARIRGSPPQPPSALIAAASGPASTIIPICLSPHTAPQSLSKDSGMWISTGPPAPSV